MFFVYFALFILAVLTPFIIQHGISFIGQEGAESITIFIFGVLGFVLYIIREKAFFKALRDRLMLQKKTNVISRDLSESYTYIGEMNRKLEVTHQMIHDLPVRTSRTRNGKKNKVLYESIFETAAILAKVDEAALFFFRNTDGKMMKVVHWGVSTGSCSISDGTFLNNEKSSWETDRCIVVRSPRTVQSVSAFLAFTKTVNRFDDWDLFKVLASSALLIYCLEGDIADDGRMTEGGGLV